MIIGLTGSIASGKSSVANYMIELGLPVIDADKVAREVVEPGTETFVQIVQQFGKRVVAEDGTLARKELGTIIFNDPAERQRLNNLIHPAIRKRMVQLKDDYIKAGEQVIIYDLPLLFESKLEHMVDKILLVYVDPDIQLKRLMERDNTSKEDALSRIESQIAIVDKVERADEVVNNNGTKEETRQQVRNILVSWGIQV